MLFSPPARKRPVANALATCLLMAAICVLPACTTLQGITQAQKNTLSYSDASRQQPLLGSVTLDGMTYAQWQHALGTTDIDELTDLLDAPELTQLVHRALAHNPSIQQSKLALDIAYKHQAVASADFLPSATLSSDARRAKDTHSRYSLGVSASWEADIWGKVSRQYAAAETRSFATEMQLQAAKNALAANIMRRYLDIIQQRQLLHIEEQRVSALKKIQKTVTARFRQGLTSLTNLSNARKNTQHASARLPEYRHSLFASERALDALIGVLTQPISPLDTEDVQLEDWAIAQQENAAQQPLAPHGQQRHQPHKPQKPHRLDATTVYTGRLVTADRYPKVLLPLARMKIQDLRLRPDLQQAYFDIRSAELKTDVAYRQLLPRVSLSATLSESARRPDKLLSSSMAWSLLAQLSAPLFDHQRLKNQADIAELQAAQQFWSYKTTLIDAYTAVKNATNRENALVAQRQSVRAALSQAKRHSRTLQAQYQRGSATLESWLTAQQQCYDLEAQLVRLDYAHRANRITIGAELGLGVYDTAK